MLIQTVLTAVGEVIESYQNEPGLASRGELAGMLATWMGLLLAAVNIPLASFLAYGAYGAMGYISLVFESLAFMFTQISLLTSNPLSVPTILGLGTTGIGALIAFQYTKDPYTRVVSVTELILTTISVGAPLIDR